jgi:hypothetical protein
MWFGLHHPNKVKVDHRPRGAIVWMTPINRRNDSSIGNLDQHVLGGVGYRGPRSASPLSRLGVPKAASAAPALRPLICAPERPILHVRKSQRSMGV